jgi:hypothetical protein
MPRRGQKQLGLCLICGAFGPLSYEHVPPAAAFNDKKVIEADIKRIIGSTEWADLSNPDLPVSAVKQRGAGGSAPCPVAPPSQTGSNYEQTLPADV